MCVSHYTIYTHTVSDESSDDNEDNDWDSDGGGGGGGGRGGLTLGSFFADLNEAVNTAGG